MGLFSKTEMHDFKVNGMGCGSCERKIDTALKSMKGVKKVDASSSEGRVTVTGKGLNSEIIVTAIESVGFTVE